ncbi:MAG TPA: TIGR02996 domain-containing protein [Kofleriaceae bacterium]|jgi:uncharacterized protein (TIGR02996 family)|nr:TIGR02996 domain-containing protein [Kofleriaceae bacterium]
MARYELGDRFWTIGRAGLDGATLSTTFGKRGHKGRTTTRTYPSAGAADAHHDDLVLEKLRAGYHLVEPPGIPPAGAAALGAAALGAAAAAPPVIDAAAAALEAAIVADPNDTEAYAVYADWLQQQGDPRGELITLSLARDAELAREPEAGAKRRSTLSLAIARHAERHAAALLGPLAALVPDVRDLASGPFTWRSGFIHRLALDNPRGRDLGAIVGDVLRHPSGRFLRELVIRAERIDDAHRVIDVLCERAPATLLELDLEVRGEPLDVSALWPAVPALRRVNLAARAFDLGAVHAPAAERARFATARLSVAAVRAIALAPWPALARLELRFGGRFEPSSSTVDDLRSLLVRGDLPALTHLKLRGCTYAGEALALIATGPLARQLVVVDLSHGHVEREDLRALASHRASFPQLRELWLPSFALPEAQRMLAGIAKHLISDARSALDTFL